MKRLPSRDRVVSFRATLGSAVLTGHDNPSPLLAGSLEPFQRLEIARADGEGAPGDEPDHKLGRLRSRLASIGAPLAPIAPVTSHRRDLERVHDPHYVASVLDGPPPSDRRGHPSASSSAVLAELGSCHAAALAALRSGVAASVSGGAYDAFWDSGGRSSPFNGLMVSAVRLLDEGTVERVAIIDASPQCGSGTQSIIERLGLGGRVLHVSLGRRFQFRRQAQLYLARIRLFESEVARFRPGIVYYQAAAGSHAGSPVGGVLSTEQMRRRDGTLFGVAYRHLVPIVWNVDGGAPPAPPEEVAIEVHLNTFREAWWTFAGSPLD